MNAAEYLQRRNEPSFQAIVAVYSQYVKTSVSAACFQTKKFLMEQCNLTEQQALYWIDEVEDFYNYVPPSESAESTEEPVAEEPTTLDADQRQAEASANDVKIAVPDIDEIRRTFDVLKVEGDVVEIRSPKAVDVGGTSTYGGLFNNAERLVAETYALSNGDSGATTNSVYWTLQQLKPEAMNNVFEACQNMVASRLNNLTKDEQVARFVFLPIDFDPVRYGKDGVMLKDQKVCTSDAEKDGAFAIVEAVHKYLAEEWGISTLLGDSGNGYHLLAKIDLVADDNGTKLVRGILDGLAAKFQTERVSIDTSVYNPSRIWKVYGTVARKGENTLERPWRTAKIIDLPELSVVPEATLRSLLAKLESEMPPEVIAQRKQNDHARTAQRIEPNANGRIPIGKRHFAIIQHLGDIHNGTQYDNFEDRLSYITEWVIANCEGCGDGGGYDPKHLYRCTRDSMRWEKNAKAADPAAEFQARIAAFDEQTKVAEEQAKAQLQDWLTDKQTLENDQAYKLVGALDEVTFGLNSKDIAKKLKARIGAVELLWKKARKEREAEKRKIEIEAATARAAQQKAEATTKTVVELVPYLLFSSDDVRRINGYPANRSEMLNLVDTLIYDDLKTIGRFYNVDGVGYYVLNGDESRPIKIAHDEQTFLNLLERYQLHAGRDETSGIGRYLGVHAINEGERVTRHISFHYNPKTFTAYYAEGLGDVLKVTRDGVTHIKNGQEGVLFDYPKEYEPWTYTPVVPGAIAQSLIPDQNSVLQKALLSGLSLEESILTDEQKHILLTVYLLLLFLPGANDSKIILQMLGPSGSGKTFFLEMIGRLLLGPKFRTTPMTSDPREFENKVINASYIVFDNVNKIEPSIKELFCQSSTGMNVVRRELFTTTGQVTIPAQATVALSALKSPLDEVEHVNRSLQFNLKERAEGTFKSSTDLKAEFDGYRNALMSEIIERVRLVLTALQVQRDYHPTTALRLADVGVFLLRVAKHEGWEDVAKKLLTAWVDEQNSGALEDDDLGAVMAEAIRDVNFASVWMTSSKFKSYLSAIGRKEGSEMEAILGRSPKALASTLVRNYASYRRRFGLEKDLDTHTKNRKFRLNPNKEQLKAIRGFDEASDGQGHQGQQAPQKPVDLNAAQPATTWVS